VEDKAKDIWSKAKGFAGGLSKTVKIAAGAVLVAVLVAVAVVVSINSNTEYEVLFTGLNTEDLRSIQSYLGEAGLTDYTIQGTDTIKVPKGKGDQLKAQLISQGYPKTGTDYSLYMQNISALSTESDRAQLVLYELQNSLGGIIRYFEGVQDAVVRITPSQDRRYVLGQDDALEAKASVVVTMKDEQTLSESLVESIRNTVSHSVKGLDVEEVAISDSQGNTYDGSSSPNGTALAEQKREYEEMYNKQLKKQALEVLVPLFGEENVSVSVNTEVDVSSSVSESVQYSKPNGIGDDENGTGLIGSQKWDTQLEAGEEGIGGPVGEEPNGDLSTYVEQARPNGDMSGLKSSGEKVYENNKVTTQQQQAGPRIVDRSVAGSINNTVPNTAIPDDLVSLVARAVGITEADQDEKVAVLVQAFWSPENDQQANTTPISNPFADIPLWVYLALLAGLFLFMVLFTVFILLGRHRSSRQVVQLEAVAEAAPLEELEEAEETPEPAGADIMDVHTERSMELRKSVREMAESNPEIAAQMIKALLRGDEDGNGG